MPRPPPTSTLFPYTTLFRSQPAAGLVDHLGFVAPPGQVGAQFSADGEGRAVQGGEPERPRRDRPVDVARSEEHTSELQSRQYLVCRLLLEKKKKKRQCENRR